ncbi:MAG: glucokinase [Deltaproteobacteria bacterium]|nr:glucokinase [Deltaproteobacteria bacterium]MBW2284104.1 glucokinase [Deltaproteobacteria bacterium]
MESDVTVLAGDIGGTKTNLGIFVRGERRPLLKIVETYSSKDASGLEDILTCFLEKHDLNVDRACFGIAGPVSGGRSKTTNLPWEISAARIGRRFGWAHVGLLNDLAATALAIPFLTGRELASLNRVRAGREKNVGLVAPGTGLGEALLLFINGRYMPVASEGGHIDFAPNSPIQLKLWTYLRRRFGHVSNERVLSGPGLANLYAFLKDEGRYREPAWLKKAMTAFDPPKVIAENALSEKSAICSAALDLFVSILGAVAGNLALTGMTSGGIYLGGGIPPRILPALRKETFMKPFTDKGRYRGFLEKVPVRVILNDRAALLGAAIRALDSIPFRNAP